LEHERYKGEQMKRILIVEDDPKIVAALTVRLKAAGYEVFIARDAVMAMAVAVQHEPDLVLLDISMPGGNGFMVAERLQNSTVLADVPIIFLTASKLPEWRKKAREIGAAGFFEKPYDAAELLDAIRKALGELVG
jgi:DNA-binding response OmpR family regulator